MNASLNDALFDGWESCSLLILQGLMHFVWQGLVIWLMLWLSLRLLRRSSAEHRYLASSVALLAMLACVPITMATLSSPDRMTKGVAASVDDPARTASSLLPRVPTPNVVRSSTSNPRYDISDSGDERSPTPANVAISSKTTSNDTRTLESASAKTVAWPKQVLPSLSEHLFVYADLIAVLYAVGVVAMLFRVAGSIWEIGRLRSSALPVDDPSLLNTLGLLAERIELKATPKIAFCRKVTTPAVIGVIRPLILLPPTIITGLSPQQVEALLLHELAHIRRHDVVFILVQRLVESFLFFHPAVWLVSRHVTAEREYCCDDLVLRADCSRVHYADALVRMAEVCIMGKTVSEDGLMANAADNTSELKRRVLRLLNSSTRPEPRLYLSLKSFAVLVPLAVMLTFGPLTFRTWSFAEEGSFATDPRPMSVIRASLIDQVKKQQFRKGTVVTLEPISGTVLGTQGQPVSGAKVFLRERPISTLSWGRNTPSESRDLAFTQTDAEGKFKFGGIKSQPLHLLRKTVLPVDLVVVAKGYATAWRAMNQYGVADFKLQPEGMVSGRVIMPSGEPASGVSVRVLRFLPLTEVANTDVVRRQYPRQVGNWLDLANTDVGLSTTVNDIGYFMLDGLPKNSGVVLKVDDDRHFNEVIYTTANPSHPVWEKNATLNNPVTSSYVVPSPYARARRKDEESTTRSEFGLRESVQVSPIQIDLKPAIRVRIRVVDQQTGEPIRNATLPKAPVFTFPSKGTTDSKGIYQYTQLTPGELTVTVHPPVGSKWISATKKVSLKEGLRETDVEVQLRRGAIVSGRVVDRVTRQGIPGVAVNNVKSNEDGSFQLITRPGKTTVSILGRVTGYETDKATNDSARNAMGKLSQQVDAQIGSPVDDVVFELEPDALFYGRTLDPDGKPIARVIITGKKNVSYLGGGISYTPIEQQSDADGGYVLSGLFAKGSRNRKSGVKVLFRDESRSLAVRFSFDRPVDANKTIRQDIRMLPAGVVTGRVLDSETKEPLPGVSVGVSFWTGDSGSNIGRAQTDAEGRYAYRCLVPDGEHTVNYRHEGFVPAEGKSAFSKHFEVPSGQTVEMPDFLMTPKKVAESIVDIPKLTPPVVEGLDAKEALEKLKNQFNKDQVDYRKRIDAAKNKNERAKVVAQREPNRVYSKAFMQLADQNPDSDVALQSLVWVCDASVVFRSTAEQNRLKAEATQRLLAEYWDRKEIIKCLPSLVYRSGTPHETAKTLLRKSPHREVRGQACLLVAEAFHRDLKNAHRWGRTSSPRDREEAIKYYRQVIADYADLSEWRLGTIGKKAERALHELEDLWIGQPAPEITGEDLQGNPLALSSHRGKIVVLTFVHDISHFALMAKTLEEYEEDEVIVLGVYAGKDRKAALAEKLKRNVTCPIWFDTTEKKPGRIAGQWNNTSWANHHVIDQKGVIRYRDIDRNRLPAAIESLWKE